MTRTKGHTRRYAFAALVVAGALAVAPASASAGCDHKDVYPGDVSQRVVKRTTLCLLNHQRKLHGRRALEPNRKLARAARKHVRDMVDREYFSHTSLGGATFVDRIMREEYVNPGEGWTLGENIAWGSYQLATPKAIVNSWMHSPGHRANILNPDFHEIGIGVVTGAPEPGVENAATYGTDFGTRL